MSRPRTRSFDILEAAKGKVVEDDASKSVSLKTKKRKASVAENSADDENLVAAVRRAADSDSDSSVTRKAKKDKKKKEKKEKKAKSESKEKKSKAATAEDDDSEGEGFHMTGAAAKAAKAAASKAAGGDEGDISGVPGSDARGTLSNFPLSAATLEALKQKGIVGLFPIQYLTFDKVC